MILRLLKFFRRKWVWFILVLAGSINVHCLVINNSVDRFSRSCDVIIVSGNSPNPNNRPNLFLRKRLETAVALYNKGVSEKMILSGAKVRNEYVEAEVMERYCLEHGVPADAITLKRQASSTIENARYTAEIMRSSSLRSACVITNRHHIARTELIFSIYLDEFVVIPRKENFVTYISYLPLRMWEQNKIRTLKK